MNSNKNQIIFFGTPQFAIPALQALHDADYPITVVTEPDQIVGRKKELTSSPVKKLAEELRLKVLQPSTLKDDEFFEQFKKLEPKLAIVTAYGKIIPEKYLSIPTRGFWNIHPSLLPKYRGPSPIQSAILNGERETGVSIMLLDKEVDHGSVLAQESYTIPPEAYATEISEVLAEQGAKLLLQTISENPAPKEQDHSQATFTKKFSLDDGKINWQRPAQEIFNQIRALNPEPGTWTTWNETALKIHRAHPAEVSEKIPPGLVKINDKIIFIGTADSPLIIEELQLAGKQKLSARDFIQGYRSIDGNLLS